MNKFELEKYKNGKYAMHCDTVEKANIFLNFLDENGKIWASGNKFTEYSLWEFYKEDTCYDFNAKMFSYLGFYRENFYTILEFDDFDWNN